MNELIPDPTLTPSLPLHPFATLFPVLPEAELHDLAASIRQHGLQNPIWTYRGQIVDGRNRSLACAMAGVPPRYQEWPGGTDADLLAFVVNQNIRRRHLTPGQLAVLALDIERELAVAAKERQLAHLKQGTETPVVEMFPQREAGKARDQAAALVGVNPHYVSDAKRLQEKAPDILARVAQAELTLPEAKRALAERIQAQARERVPAPVTEPVLLPSGRYRCIVIDPPWPMEKIEREVRPTQGVALDYPTMSLEEIAALPVPDLAEPDGCHIYLWVTQTYLPAGLDLLAKWGVRYQCLFTWNKKGGFTPYSWQYTTEHVLFGRIGHLKLLQLGLPLDFSAPSLHHSAKPEVFYAERVIPASPEPRLEMFARRVREGFTAWGNEASGPAQPL